MSQTMQRIEGTELRIEKLQAKIARLQAKVEKLNAKIASGKAEKTPSGRYYEEWDIEWAEEDIARAQREMAREEVKLAEYVAKRDKEVERDNAIPKVEAVEKFLQQWKDKAYTYYTTEVAAVRPYRDSLQDLPYEEKMKKIRNRFSANVLALYDYSRQPEELESRIQKMLNDEVNRKRLDLYARCSACVGKITDAYGLTVGDNLSLNGIVIGEKGKAEVETIYAGGYNVQVLHYRVLVKPMK